MNKTLILSAVLLFVSGHALAKKDCNELKSEIAAGMDKKGVKNYTLDIVDNASVKEGDGKVVGSCDGGTKKIVYRRN